MSKEKEKDLGEEEQSRTQFTEFSYSYPTGSDSELFRQYEQQYFDTTNIDYRNYDLGVTHGIYFRKGTPFFNNGMVASLRARKIWRQRKYGDASLTLIHDAKDLDLMWQAVFLPSKFQSKVQVGLAVGLESHLRETVELRSSAGSIHHKSRSRPAGLLSVFSVSRKMDPRIYCGGDLRLLLPGFSNFVQGGLGGHCGYRW